MTTKIIVLDTDLTFVGDIFELWQIFNKFNSQQAIGIVENQSDYYLKKNSKGQSLPFIGTQSWPAIGRG